MVLSSASPSGPRVSWCSIFLMSSALCANIKTPVFWSWTSTHLYIHCVCVVEDGLSGLWSTTQCGMTLLLCGGVRFGSQGAWRISSPWWSCPSLWHSGRGQVLEILEEGLNHLSIWRMLSNHAPGGIEGVIFLGPGVYHCRPSIFWLCLLIGGTRQHNLSLGIWWCVCMFHCTHYSLGIMGLARLGVTRISLSLQWRVPALTPTAGRVLIGHVAWCEWTSNQWWRIGQTKEAYGLNSVGGAPSTKCGSPCWTSYFPPGQICLQVQEGPFSLALAFQYRPSQCGVLRHGCRCSLILPSYSGSYKPFGHLGEPWCGSSMWQK